MVRIRATSDGTVFEGRDAAEVVEKMRDSAVHNQGMPLPQYMEEVRNWTKDESIQVDSPEAFLASLAALGYIDTLQK